jgi:hypothetical protein
MSQRSRSDLNTVQGENKMNHKDKPKLKMVLDAIIYNQHGMFEREACEYFFDYYRANEGSPKTRFEMLKNQLWNLTHLYT